jgi:hypothetical protein
VAALEPLEHPGVVVGMPMPVSETESTTVSPSRRAESVMRPPAWVKRIAFETRLKTACLIRFSSASMTGRSGSHSTASVIFCFFAHSPVSSATLVSTSDGTIGPRSSDMKPASIVARSRMSLMRRRRRSPLSSTPSTYWTCRSLSGPK